MKVEGYNFPYPVMGIGDGIAGRIALAELWYDEDTDSDYLILNVRYELDNEDLLNLIKCRNAQFVCETACSATLFRKSYSSFDLNQSIKVPKNSLRGKTTFTFTLVASTTIENYSNRRMHEDFAGFKFNIEQGEVLGYIDQVEIMAGMLYRQLKSVSSFMQIVPGDHDDGPFEIDLENERIIVRLSKEDYSLFAQPRIADNPTFASYFHSSIALPTLLYALNQLVNGENRGELLELPWAQLIDYRLKNDPQLEDFELITEDIVVLAQALLGLPVTRLINDLMNGLDAEIEES